MGGHAEAVLKRTAVLADGWMPQFDPRAQASKQAVATLRRLVREAGRQHSEVGIEGRMSLADSTPETWGPELSDWQALGATLVGVTTRGFITFDDHVAALRQLSEITKDFASG